MKQALLLLLIFISPGLSRSEEEVIDTPLTEEALLIQQLGDHSVQKRNEAEEKIREKGKSILPLLKEASESDDPEIAERAKKLSSQISSRIPDDPGSMLSRLQEKYSRAENNQTKQSLLNSFFSRPELTTEEARSALLMLHHDLNKDEEDHFPKAWYISRLMTLLYQENEKLLDQGKIKEATHLWSDTELHPSLRHRYSAMLYHSGETFNPADFSEDEASLLNAEIALWNRDFEKAETFGIKNDPFITPRLASKNFDLKERWKQELETYPSIEHCPHDLLIVYRDMAFIEDDKKTLEAILTRLRKDANETNQESHPAFLSENAVSAIKMLAIFGHYDEAASLMVKKISTELVNLNAPYMHHSIITMAEAPLFDITLLGAREDTKEAILELAESLAPLVVKEAPPKEDDPFSRSGEPSTEKEIAEQLNMQKLLCLVYYLDARGEGDQILPYLLNYIEAKEAPDQQISRFYFFFLHFISSNKPELAFQVYKKTADFKNLDEGLTPILENALFHQSFNAQESQELTHILAFINSITPENTSRVEKVRQACVLAATIKGKHPEERKELLVKAVHYINTQPDKNTGDTLAHILFTAYLPASDSTGHMIYLAENLTTPIIPCFPKNSISPYSVFFSHISSFGSEKIVKTYKQLLFEYLSTSKTLFPDNATPLPALEENDFLISNEYYRFISKAEAGAAYYYMNNRNPAAEKIKKASQMYAHSESRSRLDEFPFLMRSPSVDSGIMVQIASPEITVEEDIPHNSSFQNSLLLTILFLPYFEEQKYKESHYIGNYCLKSFSHPSLKWFFPYSFLSEISVSNNLALARLFEQTGNIRKTQEILPILHNTARQIAGHSDGFYTLRYLSDNSSQTKSLQKPYIVEDIALLKNILKKWPKFKDAEMKYVIASIMAPDVGEDISLYIRSMKDDNPLKKDYSNLQQFIKLYENNKLKEARTILETCILQENEFNLLWLSIRNMSPFIHALYPEQ